MSTLETAYARGKRLRSLRLLAGFTRALLAQKHRISTSTLQYWEEGKGSGLTEKGAQRILEILRLEGIQCSLEWLLYGVGRSPDTSEKVYLTPTEEFPPTSLSNEESGVLNEILAFRKSFSGLHTIELLLTDNSMGPHYSPDDYVAGVKSYGQDITQLVGCDCIVENHKNEIFFRRIRPGRLENTYTLISLNPNSNIPNPTLYDQTLISAARVIWHRRKIRLS